MGWFSSKKSTFEASVIRDGRGRIVQIETQKLNAAEIKKLEKLERRKVEGEKGYKALAAGVRDVMKGKGDSRAGEYGRYVMEEAKQVDHAIKKVEASKMKKPSDYAIKNPAALPLKDRVHPAEYRRILEREARKQGLL